MSRFVRGLRPDDPAIRRGCASCHSAQGFVAWRRRGEQITPEPGTVAAITCAACHDAHDASRPSALRVFDVAEPVAGAPAEGMGAGALCATCHRAGPAGADARDAAPHAPQADVLLGRGARSSPRGAGAVHGAIANTCTACHMARPAGGDPRFGFAGGHTFSARGLGERGGVPPSACSACHEEAPDAIGARDWNGDGEAGAPRAEATASLNELGGRLRAAIARRGLRGPCPTPRVAARVVDHDARLVLADAEGILLGDCDGDGRLEEGESSVGAARLPGPLGRAAYDLILLERDGSHGIHNPAYTFAVLRALSRALR